MKLVSTATSERTQTSEKNSKILKVGSGRDSA